MPATLSKKRIATFCLAATLASVSAAPVAWAESSATTALDGLLTEIAALWDAWKPWGAGPEEGVADSDPAASQGSGEPGLGPLAVPSG